MAINSIDEIAYNLLASTLVGVGGFLENPFKIDDLCFRLHLCHVVVGECESIEKTKRIFIVHLNGKWILSES
jgi:hypothetical protein